VDSVELVLHKAFEVVEFFDITFNEEALLLFRLERHDLDLVMDLPYALDLVGPYHIDNYILSLAEEAYWLVINGFRNHYSSS